MLKFWFSLNYGYAMSTAYLASQRGDALLAAEWESVAAEWQRKIDVMSINRRF